MSLAEIEPSDRTIVSGSDAEIFSCIVKPTTTLAIWRRRLSDPLADAAHRISEQALELTTTVDPFCEQARLRLRQELISATGRHYAPFYDDILDLSARYAKASRGQAVKIRLETVGDDGCRRFHLDNVIMRLVVTYRGPGTQWVRPAFATAASDLQTAYEGPLERLGTGDAAIFRGKKSGVSGLVYHRSPPITPGAPARLVAVIDDA